AGLVAALCSGAVWIVGGGPIVESSPFVPALGEAQVVLRVVWQYVFPILLAVIPLVLVRPWLRDDRALLKVRWTAAFVVFHAVWLAGCHALS
ncbi:MAG: hypothetical protein ACKOCW_13850, partial [Planctomycetaceae bacterium]